LLEALPYIQRFHGKTVIIKIGGSIMGNEKLLDLMLRDIVLLSYVGLKVILVHGGGPEISEEMRKSGKHPKFVHGMRVTDEETMEILHEQLAGKINKDIVLSINKYGGRGVGIAGMDGNFIRAKKLLYKTTTKSGREVEVDLGFVGEVEQINPTVINYLVGTGYIPVIAPIGIDAEGNSLNINADTVAAEVATAVHAKKLVLVTDVPGVLRDPKDEKSLISQLTTTEAQKLIDEKVIRGGMIPKIEACIKAVQSGVDSVHIINGIFPHALLLEILTEKGVGTMIERG
jgi:acetylglutamate kinase